MFGVLHKISKPSGSNRPHGTVVKTQNIQTVGVKPTSRQRGKNPEYPTVRIKPTSRQRGKNPEYPTVGVKPTSRQRGKNPEYPTFGIKPTSRQRGKNPVHYNIFTEPNLRYNLVHHLITSNSMFLLTCTFFQRHCILG